MADGFEGEVVYLLVKANVEKNRYNKDVYEYTQQKLEDTLVAPGPRADVLGPDRPNGVEINYTLYFLKGIEIRRNDLIVVRGETCRVVGNPERYSPGNVQTEYDLVVEVTGSSG